MIAAVRPSSQGMSALKLYLSEQSVWIAGRREWSPTETEVAVLACSGNPKQWTMFNELDRRVSELELEGKAKHIMDAIKTLEKDAFLAVFRDIEDKTPLNVEIGQWQFKTIWSTLERQLKCSRVELQKNILWKGEVTIDGNPPIVVRI